MNNIEKYELSKVAFDKEAFEWSNPYDDFIPFNEPDPGEEGYDPYQAALDAGDDPNELRQRGQLQEQYGNFGPSTYMNYGAPGGGPNPWMQRMDQAYMNDMRHMQAGPYPYGGYGGNPYGGYGGNPYGGHWGDPFGGYGGQGYQTMEWNNPYRGYGGQRRRGRFSHIKHKGDRKFLQNALRERRQERRQARRDKRQNKNQTPAPIDPVTGSVGDTTEPVTTQPAAPAPQPAAPAPQPAAPAPQPTAQPAAPAPQPAAPRPAVSPSVLSTATQAPQQPAAPALQPLPEAPAIPGGMDNLAASARQAEANNVANTAQNNLTGNLQNDIKGVQSVMPSLSAAAEGAGYNMDAPRHGVGPGPLQGLASAAQDAGYNMNAPRKPAQPTPPITQGAQAPNQDYGADSQSTAPQSNPVTPMVFDTGKTPFDAAAQIANINQQGKQDMANYKPNIELPKIDLPTLPKPGLPGAKPLGGSTPQTNVAQAPVTPQAPTS